MKHDLRYMMCYDVIWYGMNDGIGENSGLKWMR